MVKAKDAIGEARRLLGTPYSRMDCIGLIRAVIRNCPGGVKDYRCQGTNWLWRSIENASKYRHLVWRQEGIAGAKPGMLAFKRKGDDVHHVGLVTGEGTVIHSSSAKGCVVETALDDSWHLLGKHKYIEVDETAGVQAAEDMETEAPDETEEAEADDGTDASVPEIVIIDSAGNRFEPVGDFRVLIGGVD